MKVSNWMLPALLALQGVLVSTSSIGKYINTPCSANSDCGLDNHLQCINNFCQCDSFTQIYDQSTHKCLLLLGQQCQAGSGTTSEKHHHHYQHTSPINCVPNADCTKSVCRCRIGYKASVDLLCKPDFGSPCYANDDCDDGQGLICTQGACQCFNSTWDYQGQFGCVDPKNPQYNEMLRLLNQTEYLLKENNLELKDMFNDLGLQHDPDADFTVSNVLASARQFQDTYNTNDLQFAAQNQNSQQTGGGRFNLQQLLTLFQTFQNLIPRNNGGSGGGGGGGGGFFRNLFRGGGGGGGGYAQPTTTAAPSGYGASGQPEGMGQRMGLLNNFLGLFNRMIPIVRQLRMRFNPGRFFQNIIMRFSRTTTPAPVAAAIHNAPPTIITANGDYQSNPIFDDDSGQPQQGRTRGQFFMRTRERFRNFLRPQQAGYAPANPPPKYGPPPPKYGPPAKGYGPPGESPPPAAEEEAPADPPAAADPPADGAAASQQNFYTNNPRTAFRAGTAQYSTIHVTNGGQTHQQQEAPRPAPAPAQRQQSFGSNNGALPSPSTYNSGQHPNPQSFFSSQPTNQPTYQQNHDHHAGQQQQQFSSNYNTNNQNSFNAQATSHQQSTFVPHHQPSNNLPQLSHSPSPPNHQNQIFDSSTNSFVRPQTVPTISITASPPPPIPQYKLQVPIKASTHESLSQNFILTEADDPHPGFTPHSTPGPSAAEQQHQGFRTSARFERIGQEEQQYPNTAAQNWRETF